MRLRIHRYLFAFLAFAAHAQIAPEVAGTVAPATPVAPEPPPVILPLVNPADELKGRALVEALRAGGFVLYMRHALQIPPTTEKCDTPGLTPVGEEQARNVGAAIRELKIPIGRLR